MDWLTATEKKQHLERLARDLAENLVDREVMVSLEALNRYGHMVTVESCSGHGRLGYVAFRATPDFHHNFISYKLAALIEDSRGAIQARDHYEFKRDLRLVTYIYFEPWFLTDGLIWLVGACADADARSRSASC